MSKIKYNLHIIDNNDKELCNFCIDNLKKKKNIFNAINNRNKIDRTLKSIILYKCEIIKEFNRD